MEMYKLRHWIEHFFSKIKWLRAIATRYDKAAAGFRANIGLVAKAFAAR